MQVGLTAESYGPSRSRSICSILSDYPGIFCSWICLHLLGPCVPGRGKVIPFIVPFTLPSGGDEINVAYICRVTQPFTQNSYVIYSQY